MSNSASEKMLQAVAQVKERARAAQAECDRRYAQIQQKAGRSIDLFGTDAVSRVAEIRSAFTNRLTKQLVMPTGAEYGD